MRLRRCNSVIAITPVTEITATIFSRQREVGFSPAECNSASADGEQANEESQGTVPRHQVVRGRALRARVHQGRRRGMKDKLKSSEVEKLKSSKPFNSSTLQPFNPSTLQPFNPNGGAA